MTRGWCSVAVDHEVVIVDVTPPAEIDGRQALPVATVEPGKPLVFTVDVSNRSEVATDAIFRLTGLGRPLVSHAGAIAPETTEQRLTIEFVPPDRVDQGWHWLALEWIKPGGGTTERLAAADVAVTVQDVSAVRVELNPRRIRGLLGRTTAVMLENNGDQPVTLTLSASSPRPNRLDVRPDPEQIRLEPRQICRSQLRINRRTRWVGAPRDHVFDVHADGASGVITTTGTFRQYAVLPPWLFAIIALALVLVLLVLALVRVVRWVVDDEAPPEWSLVTDPDGMVGGRVGHSVTWMTHNEPPAPGIRGFGTRVSRAISGDDGDVSSVLVWGGFDADGMPTPDGAVYDADDGSWTTLAPGPSSRIGHTALWNGEFALVWGGHPIASAGSAESGRGAGWSDGWQLDPATLEWQRLPAPPESLAPRTGHTMTWTGSELIVYGGIGTDGKVLGDGAVLRAGALNSDGEQTAGDVADLTEGIWTYIGADQLAVPGGIGSDAAVRALHSATWNGEYLVISGGLGANGSVHDDVWAYDVGRDAWYVVSDEDFGARACHQSATIGSEVVFLGGLAPTDITADDLTGVCSQRPTGLAADPTAWKLTLERDPARLSPQPTWEPLVDAPDHLGADFVSGTTGSTVGILQVVRELDTVAPIRYLPGEFADVGVLPEEHVVDVHTGLVADWQGSRLFVWGGNAEFTCDGAEPDAQRAPCVLASGAIVDVGS